MPRRLTGSKRLQLAAFRALLLVCGAGSVLSCSPEPLPFEEVADLKQLMTSVIEPAAEVYWDSVGIVMDIEEGTHEIEPRTDEEWIAVRDAAFVVAESGNLMLLPGRMRDGDRWPEMVTDFVKASRAALAAAEARDPEAVFDAGGEVYLACARCHETYAPDTLRPNFDPGIIKD